MKWDLCKVAEKMGGLHDGGRVVATGASIDSRKVKHGDLFFALPGTKTDGHQFINNAVRAGAAAVVVNRKVESEAPQIIVSDVCQGLAKLATAWRQELSARIIAITGSNGKTTTKEMLVAILKQQFNVAATAGNLNNHLGVPLTLLSIDQCHEVAVMELGANHSGEIRNLCGMVAPDIAVVLNAGTAHLEGFGSVDNVARSKGELFEGLPPAGIGIVNADSPYCKQWRQTLGKRKILYFGTQARAMQFTCQPGGKQQANLTIKNKTYVFNPVLLGRHNLSNAAAAAAVAHALGVGGPAVARGLEAMRPVKGRLCRIAGINKATLIDDSYNANPDSLEAALIVLADLSDEPWLALGDMAELGEGAEKAHSWAGEKAKQYGIKRLFTVGRLSRYASLAFGDNARHFNKLEELVRCLKTALYAGVSLLVKGSRSSGMELAVAKLTQQEGGVLC